MKELDVTTRIDVVDSLEFEVTLKLDHNSLVEMIDLLLMVTRKGCKVAVEYGARHSSIEPMILNPRDEARILWKISHQVSEDIRQASFTQGGASQRGKLTLHSLDEESAVMMKMLLKPQGA